MNMYYIAIVLPEHLNEAVLKWKKYMHEKYKCKVGLKSPAHITLIPPYWMELNKEEQLLIDIDTLTSAFSPFTLHTNNFSAFRPKTVFIDVEKSEPLQKVKAETDTFFGPRKEYGMKIETRSFHPHITIATRDLFKKDFFEVWPLLEKEEFKESWEVNSLSLLRHNQKNWDVIHTSQFQKGITN